MTCKIKGLHKVYCNHCKKSFYTDARGIHSVFGKHLLTNFKCSCPYCDRVGNISNIYYFKNGKQKYMDVFYEPK